MKDKTYIFVYGTLMTGFGNSGVGEINGEYVGPATLKGDYYMGAGGCPFVYEEKPENWPDETPASEVLGELWVGKEGLSESVVLSATDQLEGHPHFYTRRLREVEHNGELYVAWVYLMENREHQVPMAKVNEDHRWDFRYTVT